MENYNNKKMTAKGDATMKGKYLSPKAEATRKALSIVEKSAMSEGQLYAYEKFWDAVINEEVLLKGSFDRGVSEGEAIGIAKGEAKANRKNAQNLKNLGIDIETISKATGLTAEEIQAL